MANRITEIRDYTTPEQWRYLDTSNNPADDITRSKKLVEFLSSSSWFQGQAFLNSPHQQWPKLPVVGVNEVGTELRKSFCGLNQATAKSQEFDVSSLNSQN